MTEQRVVRFGVFQVDFQSGELFKNGLKVRLPQQSFQVLTMLLEHPGEVVTREQLCERLWSHDTFVDFEHGLNAAIKKLRDALGDEAENPRFVETLAKRGYRFIAPVDWGKGTDAGRRRRRWLGWAAIAAPVALVAGMTAWWQLRPRTPVSTSTPTLKAVPLTSYPGEEYWPSFSPDGSHIAFVWNGEKQNNYDIYVNVVGGGTPLRLTTNPAPDFAPAWSPDGRQIAFLRNLGSRGEILLIPALGGQPERKLGDVALEVGLVTGIEPWGHRLSWSPDSAFLAFADSSDPGTGLAIFLLKVATRERRKLISPPGPAAFDSLPSFSPDGRSLAFVRYTASRRPAIFMQALAPGGEPVGEPKQTGPLLDSAPGFDWSPDGRSLVFSGRKDGEAGFWRVPASGGLAERLPISADNRGGPAISRQGNRLAFMQYQVDYNIYRASLGAAGKKEPPSQFLSSSRYDGTPQFSPDRKRIAFTSLRSGSDEIWVCASDGGNCLQLTSLGGIPAGSPRWSPDGRKVAFNAVPERSWDLFVVDADGGSPRRLTRQTSDEARPTWSRDGRWLYFASNRTGAWQIWRMPAEGGEAVQVTRNGGVEALESADGKSIYYVRRDFTGIWRAPAPGAGPPGEEKLLLEPGDEGRWAISERGIYFIKDGLRGQELDFFDFATRRIENLALLPREAVAPSYSPAFTVSPDGRTILYEHLDRAESDLMLVENFR